MYKNFWSKNKEITDKLGLIFDPLNKEVCSVCKSWSGAGVSKRDAGCCSNCAQQKGYFDRFSWLSPANAREVLTLPEFLIYLNNLQWRFKWDKNYGFFSKEFKICKLPREYRSVVCLRHCCNTLRDKLSDTKLATMRDIHDLCDQLTELRTRNHYLI